MISCLRWNYLPKPVLFFKVVETVFSNILMCQERIEEIIS